MIRRAFRERDSDTTKIIIAQRVSSVEDADLIIVMDDGRLMESVHQKAFWDQRNLQRSIWVTGQGGEEDE